MTTTNGHYNGQYAPIFPAAGDFGREDYAALRLRLDLYDDFITATRYERDGGVESSYLVDPLDVGQALSGLGISTGLLPPGCLFWQRIDGNERLAIWQPARVWSVSVVGLGRLRVPMPGLVWLGHGLRYQLYALAGNDAPDADTPLYQPPTPNVSSGVCTGNVPFPVAGAGTIAAALRLFFESEFNNHLDNGKSQKYSSIVRMWRVLNRAGATAYPLADLVPAHLTLARLMERER